MKTKNRYGVLKKKLINFQIPYWHNKRLQFTLCKLNYLTDIVYRFTIWQLIYDKEYEWCLKNWHHFNVFHYKTKDGKRRQKEEKVENLDDLINKM